MTAQRQPVEILSDNIRRYRLERGLSQADVAEKAGLSRNAYLNLEAGRSEPRSGTLVRLAEVLGISLQDLFAQPRTLTAVRFRAHRQMNSRAEVLHRVGRWLDNFDDIESILQDRSSLSLQKLRKSISAVRKDRPQRAAAQARAFFHLGERDTIRDIAGLLEDHGIKVYATTMKSEGFFGLSVGDEDGGPAVVVNTEERIPVERQIFTAVHELAHLLLHYDSFRVDRAEEDDHEEKEANLFAGCFLMPPSLFADEWAETRGHPFVDRVLKVKRIFNVSYKTVLYRVSRVSNDTGEQEVWDRFRNEYRRKYGRSLKFIEEPEPLEGSLLQCGAPARLEPRRLDPADFMADRLHRLVRVALETRKISRSRAAEILETNMSGIVELQKSWSLH